MQRAPRSRLVGDRHRAPRHGRDAARSAFDNWFWQELIPQQLRRRHGLERGGIAARLRPNFAPSTGTIDWYCIDYWSRELDLDIGAIKREARHEVRYLPGAEQFLQSCAQRGKRRVLVTNAHPETFAIKNERLALLRISTPVTRRIDSRRRKSIRISGGVSAGRSRSRRRGPCSSTTACPCSTAARRFGSRGCAPCAGPTRALPPKDTPGFVAVDGLARAALAARIQARPARFTAPDRRARAGRGAAAATTTTATTTATAPTAARAAGRFRLVAAGGRPFAAVSAGPLAAGATGVADAGSARPRPPSWRGPVPP